MVLYVPLLFLENLFGAWLQYVQRINSDLCKIQVKFILVQLWLHNMLNNTWELVDIDAMCVVWLCRLLENVKEIYEKTNVELAPTSGYLLGQWVVIATPKSLTIFLNK